LNSISVRYVFRTLKIIIRTLLKCVCGVKYSYDKYYITLRRTDVNNKWIYKKRRYKLDSLADYLIIFCGVYVTYCNMRLRRRLWPMLGGSSWGNRLSTRRIWSRWRIIVKACFRRRWRLSCPITTTAQQTCYNPISIRGWWRVWVWRIGVVSSSSNHFQKCC